jgi:hypothetical protein
LEHPTATSFLPVERISKSFAHIRHPSWLYRCKFSFE